MTLNKLASIIAKREGKRSQARIGDVREILGILADVLHEDLIESDSVKFMDALVESGERRAKRKKKPKPKA